jgi:hypothetical protein
MSYATVAQILYEGIIKNKYKEILFAPHLLVSPCRPGTGNLSQNRSKEKENVHSGMKSINPIYYYIVNFMVG